jgi:hypothetical protein
MKTGFSCLKTSFMKIMEINITLINIFSKALLLFVLLNYCYNARANNFETTISMGYGNYQLTDLRAFQKQSLTKLGVDVKSVTSFPAYFNYQLTALYYIKSKWGVGATGGFFSTGGRNHYADYSGFYKLDLLLNAKNAGLVFNRKINFTGVYLIPEISSGAKWSTLKLDEDIKVHTETKSTDYILNSLGWWVEPRIRVCYQPLSFIMLGTSVGYEYNLPSKNHLADDSDRFLMLENQKNIKIGWSGMRFSMSISFLY